MSGLTFTVAGTPRPQGSKNQFGGEASKYVKGWRSDVRDAAMKELDRYAFESQHVWWEAPLQVRIRFKLTRPNSHYRTGRNAHLLRDNAPAHPAGKPDLDKLVRAVADALTGVVWRDDAQVVAYLVTKTYSDRPGADVLIEEAS